MKLLVNICAQDGIVSHNSGVGTMTIRYIKTFIKIFKNHNIDYKINLITPEYNEWGFGFSKIVKDYNEQLENVKIYELSNGTEGKKFFGSLENWIELSNNTASIINNINFNDYDYVITLANDTPFAGILELTKSLPNHIKLWIPHSTAKIHNDLNTKFSIDRIDWENKAIDYINKNDLSYVGAVGKYIKEHLIKEYSLNPTKAIDIYNGEILSEETIYDEDEISKKLFAELDKSKDILLSFGRPEEYKNLDGAMKLAKILNIPSIVVTQEYFSGMPYVDYLKELSIETNTKLYVNAPFHYPQYIIKYYPKNIILLIPSKKEIAGLVLNEMRKFNKDNILIVINDIDGLNEQVNDGVDGILINMDNLAESANKIKNNFNIEKIKEINNNSLIRLKKDYDFEKNCLNLLKEIVGEL